MIKLKIKWMILVIKFLNHILWIIDGLQSPYLRRSESTKELYKENDKIIIQLEKELK